jgi:prephenate dehydrogenase
MAETQSLVHWIGRALARTGARPRDLDTTGYRRLLEILGYVTGDTWELFRDLQRWNPYAARARARLLASLSEIHREVAAEAEGTGNGGGPEPSPAPDPDRSSRTA